MFSQREIFSMAFSKQEQTAIINALWRRSEDDKDKGTAIEAQNEGIKYTCKQLAMLL